jgi:hypothetical protein
LTSDFAAHHERDELVDTEQRAAILDLRERPGADSEDVGSPEAIVRALYESISGPAEKEQERNWDRVRSLFLPDAQFILVRWQLPNGGEEQVLRAWDVEGFIEISRHFYGESSFFEHEVWHRTERFGHIAHVFSTYAARVNREDSEPVMRGINSIQVVNDGARWWIANLVWDLERPTNPIPERYLPGPE